MKLNQFLLLTLSIVIFSCSSDSDNSPNEEPNNETAVILLKKTIETEDDGEVYTTTYEYDNTKLTRITETDDENFDGITNYLYENDRVIEINSTGYTFRHKTTLEYNDNNTLSSYTITETEPGNSFRRVERHDFEYNTDDTVTENVFLQNSSSEFDLLNTIRISFNGNNKVEEIDSNSIDEGAYSYDGKNGVIKNVSSLNILNLISIDYGGIEYASTNNLINASEIQNGDIIEFDTYEYTYNSSDYPESAKHNFDGELSTIEFFY